MVDPHGEPFENAALWIQHGRGEYVIFRAEGKQFPSMSARLDARGEARLAGLPAGVVTLEVGGTLAEGTAKFELDLTVQPQGVQELVVEAERPARLSLMLFGAAVDSRILEVTGPELYSELREKREDVWPLDAPAFELEVRDASGAVRTDASGTRDVGGAWSLRRSTGNSTSSVNTPGPPAFELAVPRGGFDLEVRAEGHETIRLHLKPEDLVPSGESFLGWAILLRRDP